ncbi:uncharacterized protein C630.12 isoform X1 [Carica papaya]|uniref:uncharacterized protein C630.12 isoform X1 n=1 Tax=Carica papaya TaxID=3649 RepID=UPI000B8CD243|nr:uncharacterized protein C630.12 isoform X1 [Carica papaya]
MKQHQKLTFVLCIVWAITLLYGEMFTFWLPLRLCTWPHHHIQMDGLRDPSNYTKIAVIADPQLMDKTSHHLAPKSVALEIAQFYTDIYMRRAFFSSIMPFKPDIILFLGDYFDGGPYLSDEEWQESLSRFKHIFGLSRQGQISDVPVYYIPGNHDTGYSAIYSDRPEVIKRYEQEFGIRNFRFTAGNFEFIAIDAQVLDGHPQRKSDFCSLGFCQKFIHRVLLTHIPLYRPDQTYCGPQRGSAIINQRIRHTLDGKEILYQNYITDESSKKLLDLIRPDLVLSGHDHDQCTLSHETHAGTIKEHTLGTVSWQQGNLYPSFMLLSVSNVALPNASHPEKSVLTQVCFLPMQTHIYIWYLFLFVLTLLALLFWPKTGLSFLLHPISDLIKCGRMVINSNIFGGGTKEKNKDENCEYEMVWDAEGSMHLIKKIVENKSQRPSDRSFAERGNAVMRATARKNVNEEVEVCVGRETNADAVSDPMVKLLLRTSKSKTKLVFHRLIHVLKMLTVISVLNVSLYMMLLFKDWIDQ